MGSVLVEKLKKLGADSVIVPRSKDYDLCDARAAAALYSDAVPEVVFHLAAEVGGIGANRDNPGRYFFANMAMGLNMIEEGRKAGLEKFIQAGTICAYPKMTPVPFKESDLWNGYPEETNAPYGVAKKALGVMLDAYRQQYGFNGVLVLPVNLYGPGDNFNPASSHVIPALIRKCVEAAARKDKQIEVWGSGKASREFLYVEDCADGLISAAEKLEDSDPVNLGTGREVSIADLVKLIAKECGFQGELKFDPNKPDGQPRRQLDLQRSKEKLGFEAQVSLEDGLKKTIAWYKENLA